MFREIIDQLTSLYSKEAYCIENNTISNAAIHFLYLACTMENYFDNPSREIVANQINERAQSSNHRSRDS